MLTKNEDFKNGGEIMSELKEMAEGFFKDFSDTFYTPAHKAVFLLGVLAQKLLNIQYNERGSTPFRKNLKGLKMKEEDFKTLLAKIQNKLEEYKKNYYRSLETLISEYFIEAGRNWNFSTDELNFYFVLGMNLEDFMDKILNLTKEEVQK
jgi:CRISPR-associated protein Csh1